jgi:hypothetical protein
VSHFQRAARQAVVSFKQEGEDAIEAFNSNGRKAIREIEKRVSQKPLSFEQQQRRMANLMMHCLVSRQTSCWVEPTTTGRPRTATRACRLDWVTGTSRPSHTKDKFYLGSS